MTFDELEHDLSLIPVDPTKSIVWSHVVTDLGAVLSGGAEYSWDHLMMFEGPLIVFMDENSWMRYTICVSPIIYEFKVKP